MFGKMLNVEKARLDKVLSSDKIRPLVIALGAGIGETFDIAKLRYHKICLLSDADVDGAHISTLLLTFFYRHMPQVIEEGYLYLCQPPLFRVSTGKVTRYAQTRRTATQLSRTSAARDDEEHERAALQGPRRDEPGAAVGDDHEPRDAHAAPHRGHRRGEADDVFSTLMGSGSSRGATSSGARPARSATWTSDDFHCSERQTDAIATHR